MMCMLVNSLFFQIHMCIHPYCGYPHEIRGYPPRNADDIYFRWELEDILQAVESGGGTTSQALERLRHECPVCLSSLPFTKASFLISSFFIRQIVLRWRCKFCKDMLYKISSELFTVFLEIQCFPEFLFLFKWNCLEKHASLYSNPFCILAI